MRRGFGKSKTGGLPPGGNGPPEEVEKGTLGAFSKKKLFLSGICTEKQPKKCHKWGVVFGEERMVSGVEYPRPIPGSESLHFIQVLRDLNPLCAPENG